MGKERKRRAAERKHVPCECVACGGVKHVSQEERRAHLKRDKLGASRAPESNNLSATSLLPPPPPSPEQDKDLQEGSSTGQQQAIVDSEFIRDTTPSPPLRVATPPIPRAPPPGTPLSPSRAAALQEEEERTASILATIFAAHTANLNDEEVGEPLMDDDWEEEDPALAATNNNVAVPLPSSPTLPAPAVVPLEPARAEVPVQHAEGISTESSTPAMLPTVAYGVPEHKIAENEPDPFYCKTTPLPPLPSFEAVHPQQGIYLLYMLVSWLHLQFHLPFRACSAVISVVTLILCAFGNVVDPTPVVTLPRILSKLQVEPAFNILPVCPDCLEVYPAGNTTPTTCLRCNSFIFKPRPPTSKANPIPFLRYPCQSIESQLASFLAVPGVEKELDGWRKRSRVAGTYTDVFDGDIPKNLKGPDGERFFRNGPEDQSGPDGELRIALTLGVDWFSYLRSQISPSHSSCPMSFNVANLPPHLRYRTANLILCGIMPGPKEQDPDQCQRFLRILVNELLRLWKDGVKIVTPSCPEGRLVRIILIAICCDKPAAHKLGGFGSHSHTYFCTKCWITQKDKGTPEAYTKDAFRERTDRKHREAGERYTKCATNAQRDEFVKLNATRWSEFARLPYFNLCRMVVVDPMHNLILGLVKTHFYHIWVQGKILRKTKELRAFHSFLFNFKMPAYLGRLPTLMGIPAGGSLTADQWLLMATVVGPIAVPQIWHDYMLDPAAARLQREKANNARVQKKVRAAELRKEKAAAKKAATQAASSSQPTAMPTPSVNRGGQEPPAKRKRTRKAGDATHDGSYEDEEDEEEPALSCLHPDDPANFLKLCQALRILIARKITDAQIDEADILLREYCKELIVLYGPDVMRPNHHYATHTPEFVRDFGPMHGFWTFLFERLNKVLKSYKTNNHSGGELEVTFFREFHRTVLTSRLVAKSAAPGQPEIFQNAVALMFEASADDRGTVQALSRELDSTSEDDGVVFALSPRFEKQTLEIPLYYSILRYLTTLFPNLDLRSHIQFNPTPGSVPLHSTASFFDYAVVNQQRFYASNRASDNRGSLVEVLTSDVAGETWVGELLDLIHIDQGGGYAFTLGRFRWFRPLRVDISETIWRSFLPLGIKLWHENLYLNDSEPGPSSLLPLQYLKAHVARHSVVISDIPGWATITIRKNA